MDDNIDKDFFSLFIKNRINSSDVDLSGENPKERVKTINTLFKILIGMYGKSFSEQFCSSDVKDIWFNGLLVFSKEEIAKGLEYLMQDPSPYAPNLVQFIAACNKGNNKKNNKNNINSLPKLKRKKKNELIKKDC